MKYIKKKYLIYLTLGIITVFSVIIFGTYAIFQSSAAQNTTNVVSTLDCINITITGNNSALTLNNAYPLNVEEGRNQTPYNFTVKNNCNSPVEYQLILSVVNTTTITNKDYVKISLDGPVSIIQSLKHLKEEARPELSAHGFTNNYTMLTKKFLGTDSHTYDFRMWLNGDNKEIWEDDTISSKNISVKISIIGVVKSIISEAGEPLSEQILAQGDGASAIEAKPTPDFNVINGTSGLYAMEDEYGTSYYYRGIKEELNKNIIWGGFQWKIVRINGDGSVRLVYNGTEAQFNQSGAMNDTGTNTQIQTAAWNSTNYNDAKYVGYMYGGSNGSASTMRNGSTSAAATYNETSTNIKNVLEAWYQTNISSKPYEADVVDNLFCNDRQLANEVGGTNLGPGYGNTGDQTNYAARHRLETTKTPTLKCGLKNDRFTKNDVSKGNGALSHPVGLLTGDEAALAGLRYETSNSTNYLYTNLRYWLFSPSVMNSYVYARVMNVNAVGHLATNSVNYSYDGVRATLSIKGDVIVSGDGSSTNPFKVVNL